MNKKKIWIVALILTTLLTLNVANSDGLLDVLNYTDTTDTTFGYSASDEIRITNVSRSSIEIESPIIQNWSMDVESYLINVSAESRANRNPIAFWCIYDIHGEGVRIDWRNFKVELDLNDLDKNKTYYVYALPIMNAWWWGETNWYCAASEAGNFLRNGIMIWKSSMENWSDPCFNVNDNIYWKDDYCESRATSSSSQTQSSNQTQSTSSSTSQWRWEIESIKNVSHYCSNDSVILTWNSFSNVDLEIFLRTNPDWPFEKLSTVNSNTELYSFPIKYNWDHIVNLKPVDGTKTIRYTAHCLMTENPEVKPVTPVKPVVVWPKENIIMIVFGTILLYIIYTIAKRKA